MANIVVEATGAAIPDATLKGYLAEGQRQNRCLYSQDFSNAAWVSGGGGITVTTNTAVAPDGATTADTLTAPGANGTLIQDLGVVASAAKAGGMWLKRKTGTGNIDLTLDGGSTWTTVAVTSSWLLLEKTQTLADEDFGIRIVTSGDAVYAWTAQVETAAFISSPIPTTTAAVTRNADVLKYPDTSNISGTAGTAYAEASFTFLSILADYMVIGSGETNRYIIDIQNSTGVRFYDGTNIDDFTVPAISTNTTVKLGSRWASVADVFSAGNKGATAGKPFDGNININGIGIGHTSSSNYIYGTIRNARIWSQALPDATLQSITT